MADQLFRLIASLDSHFAADDQLPADAARWRELRRHITRMKDGLDLARGRHIFPVTVWEYRQIDLNDLPPKTEVNVLNELGAEGWELGGILDNHVAYLMRRMPETRQAASRSSSPTPPRPRQGRHGPPSHPASDVVRHRHRRVTTAAPAWFLWAAPNRCD